MAEQLDQFTRSYMQDIEFVSIARKALLTHPCLASDPELVLSGSVRLMAMSLIGAVECALKQLLGEDDPISTAFFAKGSNAEKMTRVLDIMRNHFGVEPDPEVLQDFLALKQLRNAVVHSSWKSGDQDLLADRGFPVRLDQFTDANWQRTKTTGAQMMSYLAGTRREQMLDYWRSGFGTSNESELERIYALTDLDCSFGESGKLSSLFIRKDNLHGVYWRNLENLAALSQHATGLSSGEQQKLTEIAIESWQEFFGLICAQHSLSEMDIAGACDALVVLHEQQAYSRVPLGFEIQTLVDAIPPAFAIEAGQWSTSKLWDRSVPDVIAEQLVSRLVNGDDIPTTGETVKALRTGAALHKAVRNATAVQYLVSRIPHSAPTQLPQLRVAATSALTAMKLRQVWYSYVEGELPDLRAIERCEAAIRGLEDTAGSDE